MKDVTATGLGVFNPDVGAGKVFLNAGILNAMRQRLLDSIGTEEVMAKEKVVNWEKIERLCLKSFCGGTLSAEEQSEIENAYRLFPEEYSKRTNEIREQERSRLRSL